MKVGNLYEGIREGRQRYEYKNSWRDRTMIIPTNITFHSRYNLI